MQYQFLKQLIEQAETYENKVSNSESLNINDFAKWVLTETSTPSDVKKASEKPNFTEGGQSSDHIGELIGLMYRYARNYSKKALEKTPLQTIDEFTYLAALMRSPMTKTQVINRHVQEKTTGMAVIQRLLKQNWVKQSDNSTDGRSQIIELTAEGRTVLMGAFSEMLKVSSIVTANLTTAEKVELNRILEKLNIFHRTILDKEKTLDLDNVLEKYTP